jgi:hypothetical protein
MTRSNYWGAVEMTIAVCVGCGAKKFGAWTTCRACGLLPHTEIDVAYSLVLTDHYFSREVLDQISSDMQRGLPRPSLPPEQEAAFLSQAREFLQSPMGSLLTSTRTTGRSA